MGNETASRRKNKNSFSVDFGHELLGKIKPNTTNLKLIPLQNERNKSRVLTKAQQQTEDNQDKNEPQSEGLDKAISQQAQQSKRQSNARLKKLNIVNDDLRKQLIRISGELTEKLRRKKFEVKKIEVVDTNQNKKQSWKKQLENAYKQIDMYKKLLSDLKLGEHSEAKAAHLQDKIKSYDIEIEKTQQQIQATKNVTTNQSAGIRKDKGWQTLEQLKSEIQALKITLKEKGKQQRIKQKQYLQQHHYMKQLQDKIKILNQQQSESGDQDKAKQGKPEAEDFEALQAEIEQLKLKHDEYHKKINNFLTGNKLLKQNKKLLKAKLEQNTKLMESLKYKRDAFVKQIKDNLHMFVTTNQTKQEQELSQFESEEEEQPSPIQEEQEERGTFDIEHLKDHQLKSIPRSELMNRESMQYKQQTQRAQPKLWRKQLTRIIQKGKRTADEKPFSTGLKHPPKMDMKIVEMSIWMNKKKQITAIQCSYLVDGRVLQGSKSSKNAQDEYKVTFELEQHDFLKSILGIFGRTGFLEYLVLQSNLGKISKIGRQQTDGDNFAIGVAKEETPVQITGANREDGPFWRINRLQFEVLIDSGQ